MKPTQKLRNLLQNNKTVIAPGVYDGMSTRLVDLAKFDLVYASGGAIARSAGLPDIGLLTMTEVCYRLEEIVRATSLPVIADADTGFGGTTNVQRTIQTYERIGVAGLHIEDQDFPKRCGHLDGKALISPEEMCQKIRVAKKSQQDPDFVIIARTDAIAVEGFDKAIERAKAYAKAGADMLFIEAPETIEQIESIAHEIKTPLLLNMFYGGKTPLVPMQRLQALGYRIVIIPSDLQRAAIKAMQITLDAIKRNGDSAEVADKMASFKEREVIIETEKFLAVDKI